MKKARSRKTNRRYFPLFLCAAILLSIVGCTSWVDQLDRDDPKNRAFYKNDTIYSEDFNTDKLRWKIIDPLFNNAQAKFPELKDPVTRSEGPTAPEVAKGIEMAFVHLSDVQIRDERVKLFGKNASRTFDNIIPSFEHGTQQEHYDYAAYLALIKTINSYMENDSISPVKKPKFMIHTGDAVDASVVEELYEFIYISNQLDDRLPWFNVLGNHDVTVFGNYDNKKVYVNDPNLTFQTLHNKFNVINMHGGGDLVDPNINAGPPEAEHNPTETGSFYHGFDLYDKMENKKYANVDNYYFCRDCPGYYSFKMRRKENGDYKFVSPIEENPPANAREIVFVVLNTTTTKFGFAKGTVDEKQDKKTN